MRIELGIVMVAASLTSTVDSAAEYHPEIFARGVISIPGEDRTITFTPDMRTAYFVRRSPATLTSPISAIVESHWASGRWSVPVVASFSGKYPDSDPFVTRDGKWMFFTSARPATGAGKDRYHVWMVAWTPTGWSEPENVTALNSPGNDAFPTVAANGALYFWSDRPPTESGGSLYRSEFRDGKYQQPEKLRAPLNSDKWPSIQPFIGPNEDYMVFVMVGRPDERLAVGSPAYTRGDLYVSFRAKDGTWKDPIHLPPPVNTAYAEGNPSVSPDGKWLFFMSERCFVPEGHDHRFTYQELIEGHSGTYDCTGNIYRVPMKVIDDLRRSEEDKR